MAGKKGRSGRKGYRKDIEIKEILELSLKTLAHYLKMDSEITHDKRADLVSKFTLKQVPDRIINEQVKALTFSERMALADKLERIVSKSHPSSVNTPQHVDTSSIKKANDTGTSTHTGTHTHISTSTTDPSPIDSGSTETNSGVRGGVEDEGTVNTFPKDILELDDTKDSLGSG